MLARLLPRKRKAVATSAPVPAAVAAQATHMAVDTQWSPYQAVPKEISIDNWRKRGFDRLRVELRTRSVLGRPNSAIELAGFLLFAAVLGFMTVKLPLPLKYPFVAAVVLVIVHGARQHLAKAGETWTLSVEGGMLSIMGRGTASRPPSVLYMPLSDVGLNEVARGRQGIEVLRLGTAGRQAHVGRGAPGQALRWLQGYIAMELAGLSWKPFFDVGRKMTRARADYSERPLTRLDLPRRIIELYLEDAPRTMERLQWAVEKGRATDIMHAAHRLKSSSANVAALRLSEQFQMLELCARDNDLANAELHYRHACFELARVTECLEGILAGTVAPGSPAAGIAEPDAGGEAASWHQAIAGRIVESAPLAEAEVEPLDASVLLVEDNAVNQFVAMEYLDALGCRVEVAENGNEALAKIQAQNFDVVLMDCHMPGMDGFEATRQIRARERALGLARLPVIAVTANALKGDREACLAAGMDDYISKPFDPNALYAALFRQLRAEPEPAAETAVGAELASDAEGVEAADAPMADGQEQQSMPLLESVIYMPDGPITPEAAATNEQAGTAQRGPRILAFGFRNESRNE